jgi:hypothetical protein
MKTFNVVDMKSSFNVYTYDEDEVGDNRLLMGFRWEKIGPRLNLLIMLPQLDNVNMLNFTKSIQFANKMQEEIILQKLGDNDLTITPINVVHACFATGCEYVGMVDLTRLTEKYST